jgi:ATP-dependent helicase/nuclease subunit A
MTQSLPDAAARRAIREDLDQSFVVEAAAGTGKTTELVSRLVAIVLTGRGRLSSIAALTFTEKAAGEMKLRIRTELDRALFDPAQSADARQRAHAALSELETASVGTIHGFCADLLRDHPVEAAVDPSFEVADTERTRMLIERAFDRWFERVLADPPEGVRRVLQRRLVDSRRSAPRLQLLAAASRLIETRDFKALWKRCMPSYKHWQRWRRKVGTATRCAKRSTSSRANWLPPRASSWMRSKSFCSSSRAIATCGPSARAKAICTGPI